MQIRHSLLPAGSLCMQRQLSSLHFGESGLGPKAYLQASLHADELPGMLVLHHLRALLEAAEQRGDLHGEIILVPVANPIGTGQVLLHDPMGRFHFPTGENFNRNYPDLSRLLLEHGIDRQLSEDSAHNQRQIRALMGQILHDLPANTELAALRRTQMLLAHDADIVLDLHCDAEAILHLYAEAPFRAQVEQLAGYLNAQATLLSNSPAGFSFDEACGRPWWYLAQELAGKYPIPPACMAVTVELRGEAQVEHELASLDAQRIYDFLQYRGLIAGAAPEPPMMLNPATPFEGSETLRAPNTGLVVFLAKPGDWLTPGQTVVQIIDPIMGHTTDIRCQTSGLMYMRRALRFAAPGDELCKIAGATARPCGGEISA